jgi:hypothetical protein
MKEYTEKTSAVYVVTFFLLVFSGLVQPALAKSVRAVPLTETKWNLLELGGQSVPKDAWRPYFVLRSIFGLTYSRSEQSFTNLSAVLVHGSKGPKIFTT